MLLARVAIDHQVTIAMNVAVYVISRTVHTMRRSSQPLNIVSFNEASHSAGSERLKVQQILIETCGHQTETENLSFSCCVCELIFLIVCLSSQVAYI